MAFVNPNPLNSVPPGTELLGLGGVVAAAELAFCLAVDVDGVCGSERGCEMPAVLEDCVGLAAPPSMAMDGGACVGAALGVAGTVDA